MNEFLNQLITELRKSLERVDFVGLVLDPEFQDGVRKIISAVRRHTKADAKVVKAVKA